MKADDFHKHLGDKLYQARRKANMSQLELSKLIGLSRSSIANIECGRQRINLQQFCKLLEFIGRDEEVLKYLGFK